ncbi:MAG: carboxypeptidase regulatory-like domain-containing protein [Bacteroidetes bacterium]|nr:carboxypeptidase regulatory-like domain-containing protein [Bacteroidota bacterium]
MLKGILLISLVIANFSFVFAQGKSSIKLTFVDDETKEPILDSIFLTLSDSIKIKFIPDKDGNYDIKGLSANKYSIKVRVKEYLDKEVKKVVVYSDRNSYVNIPMILVKEAIPKFSFGLDISFDSSKVFHEYSFSNYQDDSLIYLCGNKRQNLFDETPNKVKLTNIQIAKLYSVVYKYMTDVPVIYNGIVPSSNLFIVQFGGSPLYKIVSFSDSVNFRKLEPIIKLMDSFLEENCSFNFEKKVILFPLPPEKGSRIVLKDGFYLKRERFNWGSGKKREVYYSISKREGSDTVVVHARDGIWRKFKAEGLNKSSFISSISLQLNKVDLLNMKGNRNFPKDYDVFIVGVNINSVCSEIRLNRLEYFIDIKEFNDIVKSLNKYVPVELKINPKNIKGMLD